MCNSLVVHRIEGTVGCGALWARSGAFHIRGHNEVLFKILICFPIMHLLTQLEDPQMDAFFCCIRGKTRCKFNYNLACDDTEMRHYRL